MKLMSVLSIKMGSDLMTLTQSEKIKIILNRQNTTIAELAQRLGQSRQNMTNKLSRDNFTVQELNLIADALNCKFQGIFTLPGGEEI